MRTINKKKISAIIAGVILASSFLLLVFGLISYWIFLGVAAVTGLFAFKVLPRNEIKSGEGDSNPRIIALQAIASRLIGLKPIISRLATPACQKMSAPAAVPTVFTRYKKPLT